MGWGTWGGSSSSPPSMLPDRHCHGAGQGRGVGVTGAGEGRQQMCRRASTPSAPSPPSSCTSSDSAPHPQAAVQAATVCRTSPPSARKKQSPCTALLHPVAVQAVAACRTSPQTARTCQTCGPGYHTCRAGRQAGTEQGQQVSRRRRREAVGGWGGCGWRPTGLSPGRGVAAGWPPA